MGIGLGVPIGKFTRDGADFSPYMRMKEAELQNSEQMRAEARFRAGLAVDQNSQAFAQDMQNQQFNEAKREFDVNKAEGIADRLSREKIAGAARDARTGANGDLTKREELLYDHLNYQLTLAKYMLTKAQTSEDRARYQAEIDQLNGQISKLLQPGDQSTGGPTGAVFPAPKLSDLDVLPINPSPPVDVRDKAQGIVDDQNKAKAPDPMPIKPHVDKGPGPNSAQGGTAKANQLPATQRAVQVVLSKLDDSAKSTAANLADMLAAQSDRQFSYDEIQSQLGATPGAVQLYEAWAADGKAGKPSDYLRLVR